MRELELVGLNQEAVASGVWAAIGGGAGERLRKKGRSKVRGQVERGVLVNHVQ